MPSFAQSLEKTLQTALANLVEMLAIFAIPAALVWMFGQMVGDRRQGWAIYGAMMLLFVYVFGGAINAGSDSYVNYMLPGILLITMVLAGTLDIPASQKAARFVSFCDAFNIPLLTLVDTPGFYPGKDLEWRGMIRHGGQLVFAYARATVPRVCIILRKSYGGAYIVMDSKTMGNDLCLAWPTAELAVMGAGQAAAILQRRATPEERAAFETDYSERLLNPYIAAERGYVDSVINPEETRREVSSAFAMLRDKRERLMPRKHDNTPL